MTSGSPATHGTPDDPRLAGEPAEPRRRAPGHVDAAGPVDGRLRQRRHEEQRRHRRRQRSALRRRHRDTAHRRRQTPATPTPTGTASRTATSTSRRSDLNDDEYQTPNTYLPYPGKRPYPNPLFAGRRRRLRRRLAGARRGVRASGSTSADRTLDPLSYSDGEQYSIEPPRGATATASRPWRPPATASRRSSSAGRPPPAIATVTLLGRHRQVVRRRTTRTCTACSTSTASGDGVDRRAVLLRPRRRTRWLSDDERDEDADGLTNYDETHGRMLRRVLGVLLRDREAVLHRLQAAPTSTTRTATATASATARTTRTTTTSRT